MYFWSGRRDSNSRRSPWQGDALPLSHSRIFDCWCLRAESNHRHGDFQSPALPTELQRKVVFSVRRRYLLYHLSPCLSRTFFHFRKLFSFHRPKTMETSQSLLATRIGLEPTTSSVTGWRSTQLNYRAKMWWAQQGSNL